MSHNAAADVHSSSAGATDEDGPPLFSMILTPGSSLHPTLLLALDAAFFILLLVLVGLAVISGANLHVLALIAIEGGLWGSVKWFVYELRQTQAAEGPQAGQASQADTPFTKAKVE